MKLLLMIAVGMLSLSMNPLRGEETAPAVKVGVVAPGFSLKNEKGEEISLSDFKGQNIVLVFSRAHW